MRFIDLPDSHWAYSYVAYLYCNGVVSGYSDGTFRPGESTSRGQIMKMITLGFGWSLYNPIEPDFTDVPVGHTYYLYVETAYLNGIVTGYEDGTFRPANYVSRAQVTKMLVLGKGWIPYYPPYPSFGDVPTDYWAYGYIEASYSHGIISGYGDGTLRPGNLVNRGQC